MKYVIVCVTLLLSHISFSQSDFVVIEDFSQIDQTDWVTQMINYNDTLYHLIQLVCDSPNNPDSLFFCSAILVTDKEGQEIDRAYYPDINHNRFYDCMLIEEDRILLTYGDFFIPDAKQHIAVIDRRSLIITETSELDSGLGVQSSTCYGFAKYENNYFLSCFNRYNDGHNNDSDFVGYVFVLNELLEIDKVLFYANIVNNGYYYDLHFHNENVILYYVTKLEIGGESHGFITLDSNFELFSQYKDGYDLGYSFSSQHNTGMLPNGDLIYSHITMTKDGEVVSISPSGTVNWVVDLPRRNYTSKTAVDMEVTKEGDILIIGSMDFNFEFFNYDWLDPEKNSWIGSPYLCKLDGETGELLWEHFYVGFNDLGYLKFNGGYDVVELDSGELMVGGYAHIREDTVGIYEETNMFLFTVPADGCLHPDYNCSFPQFIESIPSSVSDDVMSLHPLEVYPSITHDRIDIALPDTDYRGYISISDFSGNVIDQVSTDSNKLTYTLSGYTDGVYIVTYTSEKGKVYGAKVVKQ